MKDFLKICFVSVVFQASDLLYLQNLDVLQCCAKVLGHCHFFTLPFQGARLSCDLLKWTSSVVLQASCRFFNICLWTLAAFLVIFITVTENGQMKVPVIYFFNC